MSKKRETMGRQRFLACFVCGPQPPEKSIYSSECYQTRSQDFATRGGTKSKLFAPRLSDLGFLLNKLMQLKRVTNGGIVPKCIVTVDGGLGAKPPAPSLWPIFVILQPKRSNFYVILIALRSF